jgi:hypothetical protein
MSSSPPTSPDLLLPLALALAGLVVFVLLVGRVPLRYNVRNLLVRWPITLLTLAAFALVIALMVWMFAFVNGMYRLTEGSVRPGNVIVLSDGATDEVFSTLGHQETGDVEREPGILRDEHDRPLCSAEAFIVVNQPIPGAGAGRRQRRFIQVRGLDDPVLAGKVHGFRLHDGGAWFSPAGVELLAATGGDPGEPVIQAVLGEGIAREMGPDQHKPTLRPGDLFALGGRRWVVTGVLRSAGSTFDSEVWAKRQVVGPLFGKTNYSTLVLRTADAETAWNVARDLTANFKKAALQAQTEAAYYDKLNATNLQFLVISIVATTVLAVGGIFGVMNAMFAAISAHQGHRRAAPARLRPAADPRVLAARIVGALPGRRVARLRRRLPGRRLVHQQHHRQPRRRRQECGSATGRGRQHPRGRTAADPPHGWSGRAAAGALRPAAEAPRLAPLTGARRPRGRALEEERRLFLERGRRPRLLGRDVRHAGGAVGGAKLAAVVQHRAALGRVVKQHLLLLSPCRHCLQQPLQGVLRHLLPFDRDHRLGSTLLDRDRDQGVWDGVPLHGRRPLVRGQVGRFQHLLQGRVTRGQDEEDQQHQADVDQGRHVQPGLVVVNLRLRRIQIKGDLGELRMALEEPGARPAVAKRGHAGR